MEGTQCDAFIAFLQVCIALNTAPVAFHQAVQEALHRHIDLKRKVMQSRYDQVCPKDEENPYLLEAIAQIQDCELRASVSLDRWPSWCRIALALFAILSFFILYLLECGRLNEWKALYDWVIGMAVNGWLLVLLSPFVIYCFLIFIVERRVRSDIKDAENHFNKNVKVAERFHSQASKEIAKTGLE